MLPNKLEPNQNIYIYIFNICLSLKLPYEMPFNKSTATKIQKEKTATKCCQRHPLDSFGSHAEDAIPCEFFCALKFHPACSIWWECRCTAKSIAVWLEKFLHQNLDCLSSCHCASDSCCTDLRCFQLLDLWCFNLLFLERIGSMNDPWFLFCTLWLFGDFGEASFFGSDGIFLFLGPSGHGWINTPPLQTLDPAQNFSGFWGQLDLHLTGTVSRLITSSNPRSCETII